MNRLFYSISCCCFATFLFSSCTGRSHSPNKVEVLIDSAEEDTEGTVDASLYSGIDSDSLVESDADARGKTSSQNAMYSHLSIEDEAYEAGYSQGYDDGFTDAETGQEHGISFDEDNDYSGEAAEQYEEGYTAGYDEGFSELSR